MALLRKIVLRLLSLLNYYFRSISVFHHPGKQVIKPFQELRFSEKEQAFLELAARSSNFEHDYSHGSRLPEISVTRLKNVTLLGNSGALIQNDRVITESAASSRRLAHSPAWRMPALMVNKNKKGLYTSIFHFPWAETSNYHWFFDCLPRLYALAQVVKEPVTMVANAHMPRFQQESLRMVLNDIPNLTVEYISKHQKWACENFLFPSFVIHPGGGFLPPEATVFLREKLFKGYGIIQKPPFRKIFISRSTATKRRIINEAELYPVLEQHGFEIIFPEKLSYREQVQLFYESRVIAGAHGAGFTNTFFAQKATVLELHPANAIKAHYFLLTKGLNFDYHYIIGSNANDKLDFRVPVEPFEEKLQEIP